MNPSPSPIPVTVVAPPPEWWQIVAALSPFAVLIGAIVAGIIGFNQIKQKREADNRAEWWKRTQWALDAVNSGEPRRGTMGLKVLTVLAESDLAGKGELDVLAAAWENPLDEAEQDLKASAEGSAGDTETFTDDRGNHWSVELPDLEQQAGVDDEPGPRDNEEDDDAEPAEGGRR